MAVKTICIDVCHKIIQQSLVYDQHNSQRYNSAANSEKGTLVRDKVNVRRNQARNLFLEGYNQKVIHKKYVALNIFCISKL